MSDETPRKEAILHALQMRLGMPEGDLAKLHAEKEKQGDWWGICRRCHQRVTGTPAELRAHSCGQ
jgi:hypothetical protein